MKLQCAKSLDCLGANQYIGQQERWNSDNSEHVMVRSLSVLVVVFVVGVGAVHAQGSAGTSATIEPRGLIDVPTAGMLPQRNVGVDLNFFQAGGVLAGFSVAITDRILIGVSYGGTSLLGTLKESWNLRPGVNLKVRLLNETFFIPAIAVGFDSQGKEAYIDSLNRYTVKSLGFYAVGSKNYQVLGYFSIHGGLNYSLEQADNNRSVNIFCGVEKSVGPFATAVAEYNFNLNDDIRRDSGNEGGYLNVGIRVSIGSGYTLGFNFKDVSHSFSNISVGNRTIQIEYVSPF